MASSDGGGGKILPAIVDRGSEAGGSALGIAELTQNRIIYDGESSGVATFFEVTNVGACAPSNA